jgi:hypothetical protein
LYGTTAAPDNGILDHLLEHVWCQGFLYCWNGLELTGFNPPGGSCGLFLILLMIACELTSQKAVAVYCSYTFNKPVLIELSQVVVVVLMTLMLLTKLCQLTSRAVMSERGFLPLQQESVE